MNATQMEFIATGGAQSQTDRLIEVLHAAEGEWLPLPYLVERIGAYAIHSRVSDARQMGVNIENRVEFNKATGKRMSFYRLLAP